VLLRPFSHEAKTDLTAYPFWALTIIAVDVALYGLCAYGSRRNLEAL
jgi:putative exporter of polyketide antibiotics